MKLYRCDRCKEVDYGSIGMVTLKTFNVRTSITSLEYHLCFLCELAVKELIEKGNTF